MMGATPRPPTALEEPATDHARRKVLAAQNVSRMCLVCGTQNALGLRGRFYELEGAGGAAASAPGAPELLGVFTPREEHQSYPGRLHGGIAGAILDETIGRAILLADRNAWGVTAEFTVRFRKPLPLGGELRCLARLTRDTSRLFEGTGEILLPDGSVAAEGRGKYVKMGIEAIAAGGMAEGEWLADGRERPDEVELAPHPPGRG
jgi:acyl-coenzyme A thioesterase PaaI-like protein